MDKAPHGSKRCKFCRVIKPHVEFWKCENGRPRDYCRSCKAPRLSERPKAPRGMRTCKLCKQARPIDCFETTPLGAPFPYCKDCGKPTHRIRPYGTWAVADHNCVVCDGSIAADVPQSRINLRKTCSTECRIKHSRRPHACSRCQQIKPFEAFDARKVGRGRARICKECIERDTNVVDGHHFLRRPYAGFRANILKIAKNRRLPVHMSEAHIEAMYSSGCQLCGKLVSIAVIKQGSRAVSHYTLDLFCARCGRIAKAIGVTEMLCMVHEIYAHAPLLPHAEQTQS